MAEGASITIESPRSELVMNNSSPIFSGLAGLGESEEESPIFITLVIHSGSSVTGTPVQTRETALLSFGTWVIATSPALEDGTYTAQATETGEEHKVVTPSKPVTFTIDTKVPNVSVSSPANGSTTSAETVTIEGGAGVESGDTGTVTVQLLTGSASGPLKEAHIAQVSNGRWSTPFGGLSPGTYTAQAEQSDEARNVGLSAPITFTVTTPPPPPVTPPPAASFTWFPTAPRTGENVSLVSSATDMTSPITAFAWGFTGTGAFQAGKPVLTTSFSTPGGHVVRLRVTAADGLSSIATETIKVDSSPLALMQPFPIVRIAGSETFSGVALRLLTAQAPAGSRITITCKGHACPAKSESRVAASSKKRASGTVTVEFRRFERALQAGVVLEIRIFKAGQIGKFTRFTVRHDKLPERDDACLGPTGGKPIVCPSS
jgi:hypothetical protein